LVLFIMAEQPLQQSSGRSINVALRRHADELSDWWTRATRERRRKSTHARLSSSSATASFIAVD
jgi:hypothetical protein